MGRQRKFWTLLKRKTRRFLGWLQCVTYMEDHLGTNSYWRIRWTIKKPMKKMSRLELTRCRHILGWYPNNGNVIMQRRESYLNSLMLPMNSNCKNLFNVGMSQKYLKDMDMDIVKINKKVGWIIRNRMDKKKLKKIWKTRECWKLKWLVDSLILLIKLFRHKWMDSMIHLGFSINSNLNNNQINKAFHPLICK